jgi:Family of unknown function (DUF5947)
MTSMPPQKQSPWSTLRRFARPRPPVERCDLCSAPLAPTHRHLLEPATRQMRCSCDPCSILFSGREDARFRRVEPKAELLTDFRLPDAQWEDFHLPINLAYFVPSSVAGRVQAYFPSPAGATESLLTLDAWEALAAENRVLDALEADVEALLVNRLGRTRAHYLVSIDECFTLVGLIRTHWRGLSGGTAVWDEIGRFMSGLDARSQPAGGTRHAGPEL